MNLLRPPVKRALLVALLASSLALALSSEASAQSPSASQYADCPSSTLEGVSANCILSIGDGVEHIAANAGQGATAVNEVLTEPVSSAAASTASPTSTTAPGEAAVPESSETAKRPKEKAGEDKAKEDEGAGRDKGLASLTALPETGGPSLAVLGSGALLVALGLLIRRTTYR